MIAIVLLGCVFLVAPLLTTQPVAKAGRIEIGTFPDGNCMILDGTTVEVTLTQAEPVGKHPFQWLEGVDGAQKKWSAVGAAQYRYRVGDSVTLFHSSVKLLGASNSTWLADPPVRLNP